MQQQRRLRPGFFNFDKVSRGRLECHFQAQNSECNRAGRIVAGFDKVN